MKILQIPVRCEEVVILCQMLQKLGYAVKISDLFSSEVQLAVQDFQRKNGLLPDGKVGSITWQCLQNKIKPQIPADSKSLSEQNLKDFAQKYHLELAVVKSVNEVESGGKGFLPDGRPKILFEGHIFWKELVKRGVNPSTLLNSSCCNVLYCKWTKTYYKGGAKEFDRLNQAIALGSNPAIKDAALCAASWGSFQIMGFHWKSLGYSNIGDFVKKMETSEKEQLMAFGKFLEVNNLIRFLVSKNWASFACGYNGGGYKMNKYDEKLYRAYLKYS